MGCNCMSKYKHILESRFLREFIEANTPDNRLIKNHLTKRQLKNLKRKIKEFVQAPTTGQAHAMAKHRMKRLLREFPDITVDDLGFIKPPI